MQTKAAPPIGLLQGRKTLPLIEAYFELNHLKQLFRQGWLRVGLPPAKCESVAEHSLFVAPLGLFVADGFFPEADASKVVRIALLHDLGEPMTGWAARTSTRWSGRRWRPSSRRAARESTRTRREDAAHGPEEILQVRGARVLRPVRRPRDVGPSAGVSRQSANAGSHLRAAR